MQTQEIDWQGRAQWAEEELAHLRSEVIRLEEEVSMRDEEISQLTHEVAEAYDQGLEDGRWDG